MAEAATSPWSPLLDPARTPTNGDSNHHEASPTATSSTGDSQRSQSRKAKQKRNKPTLSCRECVEHKTKCDRGRPKCLACIKRSTSCEYTQIAEIINANEASNVTKSKRAHRASEDDRTASSKLSIANITHPSPGNAFSPTSQNSTSASQYSQSVNPNQKESEKTPRSNASNSNMASVLSMETAPLSVLELGAEHPFANYWTCKGGLAEVIGVLPSKSQADILVAKYFEIVDSVYPILDRPSFLRQYEHFWSLSEEEKCSVEGAAVSLYFAIYATATQYMDLPPSERIKTAEFYISASHQALRISSYLNRMSITTVQVMVLIFYFLIHDNHVSDAWTFSGITHRQAYVLKLNREPDIVVPNATIAEKNMRCKLWSAIVFQEAVISMALKLPSTSLQSDVGPHSLNYDEADKTVNFNTSLQENGECAISELCSELTKTDISYCKSIWAYSTFVQENISGKRALGLSICSSSGHKRDLVSAFRSLYRSLPTPFGSYDPKRFLDPSRRVARQQIALTQNFFHALMLLCADENNQADVMVDSLGTLEAAHEGLSAFFAMNALFGDETNTWWASQHRAFEEALLVANLLAADQKPLFPQSLTSAMNREYELLVTAKGDCHRMLEIIRQSRGTLEYKSVQDQRHKKLKAVLDRVTVV